MFKITSIIFITLGLFSSSLTAVLNNEPQPLNSNSLVVPIVQSGMKGQQKPHSVEPLTSPVPQYILYNYRGPQDPIIPAQQNLPEVGYNPWFGLSSDGNFQLSAYFGQFFWCAVGLLVTIAGVCGVVSYFGTKEIQKIVKKIQEGGSGVGKALDLDRLSNVVMDALEDKYEKWTGSNKESSRSKSS